MASKKRVSRATRKISTSRRIVADEAHAAVRALGEQILGAHDATNELMKVQFSAVDRNFERVHAAMAEVKKDLKEETERLSKEVEVNRETADDRHLSLVKKVWFGAGMVAILEIAFQVFPNLFHK